MGEQFIKDYKENEELRNSFFQLAHSVFGLNLQNWHEKGYWGSRYIPFSYVADNQIVANVSVNILNTIIEGQKKKAIQIGTVMTHPDYRNQGLSAKLMNQILYEYEDQCDFMYLFANETVLDYYPKFGFSPINDYHFSMEWLSSRQNPVSMKQLDGTNSEDLSFIYQFAAARVPVSQTFGTVQAEDLFMFHCINVFPEYIYYLPEEDMIAIFEKQEQQLKIYDLISKKTINIEETISKLADEHTTEVSFYFTPDLEASKLRKQLYTTNDQLFIRAKDNLSLPAAFQHPITSQA
ncbi:GNAT family N-acetyltransferase [Pseudobacillus wudalianchiensis]|uniref:GCN5 family acetyltransferase n=1 Tax=Pseudobacillus wudalianchiensis TaxID=1743143 RepID=A0A1B9AAL4_9BACI|nr:GNAT family N-acetyltransferase [Bacillus wudalianchiensis]OCA80880.1 GCN5 family acetyltransferase [Bacillus wudalianchiensis]